MSDVIHTHGILVRPSIYARVKTECGIRYVPSGSRLDEQDRSTLSDWLQRRHAEIAPQSDPDALLFADNERSHFPLPDRMVTERLVQALRLASGDPELRLRHLRHNFATCQLLSTRPGRYSDGDELSIQSHWQGEKRSVDIAATLPPATGDLYGRRSLWMLSAELGHSVPSTTLCHYTHSCDLLLGAAMTAEMPQFTSAQLGGIANLSASNVRQLQKRKADRLIPYILERRRKELGKVRKLSVPAWLDAQHHGDLALPPAESPDTRGNVNYTLSTICRVLWMLKRNTAYKTAIKYQLPDQIVEAWGEANAAIRSLETPRGSLRHPEVYRCGEQATDIGSRVSAAFKALPIADSRLCQGLREYALGRLGGRPYIDFTYQDDLRKYLDLLTLTGLRPDEIVCSMGKKADVLPQLAHLAHWTTDFSEPSLHDAPAANCYRVRVIHGKQTEGAGHTTVAHHWPFHMALVDLVARGEVDIPDFPGCGLELPESAATELDGSTGN